jgi:hypothetical protein
MVLANPTNIKSISGEATPSTKARWARVVGQLKPKIMLGQLKLLIQRAF